MAGMREPLNQYQSSGEVVIGPFLSSTDGKTPMTSLTIAQADIRLSKNNAAFAQKSDATSATHNGDGMYNITLDATDVDTAGHIFIAVNVAGARPVKRKFKVGPGSTS